jgi:hypothetical protein
MFEQKAKEKLNVRYILKLIYVAIKRKNWAESIAQR